MITCLKFFAGVGLISSIAMIAPTAVLAQKNSNADKEGFVKIFDGKSLAGWDYDSVYWRVEDGNLVGEITPDKLVKTNTFIIWKGGEPSDFELRLEYRISESGNSGINYRSERRTDVAYALKGYQSDIDGRNRYTGQNYEEKSRTTLAYIGQKTEVTPPGDGVRRLEDLIKNNAWTLVRVTGSTGDADALRATVKSNDWNEVHLVIRGNRLRHYVNGKLFSEVIDNDRVNRRMKGFIGVQVHVGPPMKVEYRNIRLKTSR